MLGLESPPLRKSTQNAHDQFGKLTIPNGVIHGSNVWIKKAHGLPLLWCWGSISLTEWQMPNTICPFMTRATSRKVELGALLQVLKKLSHFWVGRLSVSRGSLLSWCEESKLVQKLLESSLLFHILYVSTNQIPLVLSVDEDGGRRETLSLLLSSSNIE